MELILGSMKSGKSALLLGVANDLSKTKGQNEKLIFIRPSCDNRDFISRGREPDIHLKFGDERTNLQNYDYIFIDEIQFFNKQYIQYLIGLENKKVLMLAGLNANIHNQTWSNITTLIPYASAIEFLKANCDICGAKESAIHHIGDDKVGDNYVVVCPKCYKK